MGKRNDMNEGKKDVLGDERRKGHNMGLGKSAKDLKKSALRKKNN